MTAQPDERPAFSLRHLVIEVVEAQPSATAEDQRLVAREVLRRIPRQHKNAAFLTALAAYVREVNHGRRPQLRAVPPLPSGKDNANSAASGTARMMRRLGELLRSDYALIKDKEIGDYDRDDCEIVAADLEKRAAEMATKAEQYRTVAARLGESGVKHVRDLPGAFLLSVFYGGHA